MMAKGKERNTKVITAKYKLDQGIKLNNKDLIKLKYSHFDSFGYETPALTEAFNKISSQRIQEQEEVVIENGELAR